ncbi:AAA family ATPase [Nonomuraea sp. NN258]|uniref:helix-turn-helix transcriptional regulator n=1 Tax=Nonomuraea antri TaxID=2730852 RepID=UPI001569DC63|nr:helix-turn-helix transcriptional regulator [Nonomuraea antri]NRQ38305.1 AAA family ATPase [Nonomuraea antri]
MLHGREQEQAHLSRLLGEAAAGRGGALVVLGEPGGGKSALLAWAAVAAAAGVAPAASMAAASMAAAAPAVTAASAATGASAATAAAAATAVAAPGFQVLRCTGVESEAELPFAALHLLLSPAMRRLPALPAPQAQALRGAFGLAAPGGEHQFLVGLAALSLLAELAADGPVLCLVDDAQWLDRPSAEALAFAARRLAAEGVFVLFAAREGFDLPGVPELTLKRLDQVAARELLAEHDPGLPGHVRDRLLTEADGNPLALLELPRTEADDLGPLPLPHRLQDAYHRRINELPAPTRTALLVAAAEESGALESVLHAMAELGVPAGALAAAERDGLVAVSGQSVVFRHPLIRTAAYRGAAFTDRLAAHAALASALASDGDGDRAAWHRAAAVTGPDEEVAADLEAAAVRARRRSGHATAVAALERAARLTPGNAARARRLATAAETAVDAGRPDHARHLAGQAARLTEDARERARIAAVHGRVEYEHGSLRTVHEVLVAAARQVAPLDPDAAAAMLADAARASWSAGDPERVTRTYRMLRELPPDPFRDKLVESIGGALKLYSADVTEAAEGAALLREHIAQGRSGPPGLRLNVAMQALLTGDYDDTRDIMAGLADDVRSSGAVGRLPSVLCAQATAETNLARYRDAAACAAEALRIAEDVDQPSRVAHAEALLAYLAAVAGDEERCRSLAEPNLRRFPAHANALVAAWCEWALALLDLGRGRYLAVLDRLETATRGPILHVGPAVHFAADQVEAAVRLGRPERAAEPLARLEQWAAAVRLPWEDGLVLRCRALLSDDGGLYVRALELQDEARPFERARTELLYGEWLRRERRKTEARAHLREALERFERLGAAAWAGHARAELRAAGESAAPESVRDAPADVVAQLTPQELQVVRLAATGATNKEIAARLFLSPKTVGHHLYRAFPKLGVSTRTELARLPLN